MKWHLFNHGVYKGDKVEIDFICTQKEQFYTVNPFLLLLCSKLHYEKKKKSNIKIK